MTKNLKQVVVIGAGPAGLFAAECLLQGGFRVSLYDQMPKPLSKFVLAGRHGGLNITHSAPPELFASAYGVNQKRFARWLAEFSPENLQAWLALLGIHVEVGSSGKVFPKNASASDIRNLWLAGLNAFDGFSFFPRHKFSGIRDARTVVFETPDQTVCVDAPAALFALGGASWPATGSDGDWVNIFRRRKIQIQPFEPANCGFEADWPPFLKERFNHVPLKNVTLTLGRQSVRGELLLTSYGVEGGVIYALGPSIRKSIAQTGVSTVWLDLMPDVSKEKILSRLGGGPQKDTLSNFFRKKLKVAPPALLLMRECASPDSLQDARLVAELVKHLPVKLYRPRPLEEAISSAGGVCFCELDDHLMLKAFPGWFCVGEMLDWEAPTGGFLLQGCFSTAHRAAQGVANWLTSRKTQTDKG